MALKGLKSTILLAKPKLVTIRGLLFILPVVMIVGLTWLYFLNKPTSVEEKVPNQLYKDVKIDLNAALALNQIQHTSTKNGVKEWRLEATSAKLLKNQSKALITDISLIFFLKDGLNIYVTAKEGYLNTNSNDIDLSDNVVVKYADSILTTDQLHYNKKIHIIYSNEHVTVTNNGSLLKSDSMKFDLNNNRLELKGNVYAILSESPLFSKQLTQ
ncbi:MAG: LPS export ABC transporter periplasmic protein LptC [Desulfamplus sp.]|nr:LPS export ABC transporter periplasmic protein LptC [Desulfamplus sp.]MBF0389049.1 LPS export ABC transporter periplasmic protein LptC [Desulfamplus sp.]